MKRNYRNRHRMIDEKNTRTCSCRNHGTRLDCGCRYNLYRYTGWIRVTAHRQQDRRKRLHEKHRGEKLKIYSTKHGNQTSLNHSQRRISSWKSQLKTCISLVLLVSDGRMSLKNKYSINDVTWTKLRRLRNLMVLWFPFSFSVLAFIVWAVIGNLSWTPAIAILWLIQSGGSFHCPQYLRIFLVQNFRVKLCPAE